MDEARPTAEDRVLVAVSRDGRLRARAAQTTGLVAEGVRRHRPAPLGAEALARALTCAAVLPATWKDCERISVQWSGDGPLKTVLVEARQDGAIRGFAKEPAAGVRVDRPGYRGLAHGFLPGGFVCVLKQDRTGRHSEGRVPLATGEIDEDLEAFFEQSDQVPTRLRALVARGGGGVPGACSGLLLQALPDGHPPDLPPAAALEALDPATPPEALLEAAAPGRGFDVLEVRPLGFRCPCSRERSAAGIGLLDVDELLDMVNEDQGATVSCGFCAAVYRFGREELERIMVRKVTGGGTGDG